MLIRRLEEEQSILVKEMSQHITSLRKEIKAVDKLQENIRMGCKSNSDFYFFSLTKLVPFLLLNSPQLDYSNFLCISHIVYKPQDSVLCKLKETKPYHFHINCPRVLT